MRIYKCDIICEYEFTRGNPEAISRSPQFSNKNMEPLVGIRNPLVRIWNRVSRSRNTLVA